MLAALLVAVAFALVLVPHDEEPSRVGSVATSSALFRSWGLRSLLCPSSAFQQIIRHRSGRGSVGLAFSDDALAGTTA